jgi:7,8-dihydropterin-6-yl-methyl-4-(beta-D-ribofuranosyl)aminobenzene 5'-phosphate synthase
MILRSLKSFFFFLFLTTALEATEYEITILATNTANFGGIGEWSFSALLESEKESIIFDTGFDENTVLHNANLLGKDLSKVEKVILSHFHGDHTGGLIKLRKTFMEENPNAFSKVYVADGFFEQRYDKDGNLRGFIGGFDDVTEFIQETENIGISFIVIKESYEIAKNLMLSGPVERIFEKVVVSPGFYLKKNGKLIDDLLKDDQSLGIKTSKGWYMMSGCGHAGMMNTAHKFQTIDDNDVYGAIGGFHLYRSSDDDISETAYSLKEFGLKQLIGGHCTGIHAARKIADIASISRDNLSHGAIGTVITKDLRILRSSVE